MRLTTRRRTTPAAGTHTLLPTELPPGFQWATDTPHDAAPHHREAPRDAGPASPPLSGPLTTVTSRSGTDVHLHRADYRRPTEHGGWTIHGYAWRCTGCSTMSPGYEPREFRDALTDARTHHCGQGGQP